MRVFEKTRGDYYKTTKTNKGCPFCSKETINKQNCTIFSFEHWYVLVNKHPYMDGNVMLVTKKHHENLDTLTMDEWSEFSKAVIEVQATLQKMFKTKSFNIGINIGEDSGGSVLHVHWQIIPRRKKNHSVVSTLADIQVITLSFDELKIKLSK